MSQYIRTFVIPDDKDVVAEQNGQYLLKDNLVAEVVILNSDVDDYTDEMTSMDFTSVRSRITVHKGFAAEHPLPTFAVLILNLLGIRIDPRFTILLAALYEETGFNEYSREECDKLFLNTVLEPIHNQLLHFIVYELLLIVVGNNYAWNNNSDQITVATLEPIWN
jgi:hypothetical protein